MEELNSIDVARAVMSIADKKGVRLNMTQLQKLLYIVYGTSLVILNRRPFDEHAQAWPFGPVFPKTRRKLLDDVKNWKISKIPEYIPDDLIYVVKSVVDFFGTWNAKRLIDWAHSEGGPWFITTKMPDFKWSQEIGDGLIKDYFKKIVVTESAQYAMDVFGSQKYASMSNKSSTFPKYETATETSETEP